MHAVKYRGVIFRSARRGRLRGALQRRRLHRRSGGLALLPEAWWRFGATVCAVQVGSELFLARCARTPHRLELRALGGEVLLEAWEEADGVLSVYVRWGARGAWRGRLRVLALGSALSLRKPGWRGLLAWVAPSHLALRVEDTPPWEARLWW